MMKTLIPLTISSVLVLCLACQQWDLDRIDFVELTILNTNSIALSELQVEAEIKGLNDTKITQHGFVWSALDSIPELGGLNNNELLLGAKNSNGLFDALLPNLSIETTYFIRVFAIIDNITYYGDVLTYFNENRVLIEMIDVKVITGTTNALAKASIQGLLSNEAIEQYGHCWSSTNPNPKISDNSTSLGVSIGNIEDFSSTITNLEPSITYYVRPYVTIAGIVIYGQSQTLTKGNYWVERDGLPIQGIESAKYFSIDGKGYFVLGVIAGIPSNEMWEYTPENNSWRQLPNFPGEFRTYAFSSHKNRKIYIGLGGVNLSNPEGTYFTDVWQFDLDTEIWSLKAPFPGAPRAGTQDWNLGDNLYMIFGADERPQETIRYDEAWQFDPDWDNGENVPSGKWTLLNGSCGLSVVRHFGNSFAINGVGYMTGGSGLQGILGSQLWGFIPNNNTPCQEYDAYADIGQSKEGSIVTVDGQKGYFGCGHIGGIRTGNFWQFDPSGFNESSGLSGQWTQLADFANGTEKRSDGLAFFLNGRIFFGFGISDTANPANSLWEYIPDKE